MLSRHQGRLTGLRYPWAEDEASWVEDCGKVGHQLAEVAPDDVEALASRSIALLGGQRDLFALNALWRPTTELEETTTRAGEVLASSRASWTSARPLAYCS